MISAVVLTKNEEKNLARCLGSLNFVDEIIVVDDNSIDKSVEIAKKFGAGVYKRLLNKGFADQRNFGLLKAKNEWVLFVDADEVVSKALAFEIKNYKLKITNYSGFYITRRDHLLGRRLNYGENGHTKLIRLAKKNSGEWVRGVHETWEIKEKTGELKNYLEHYPHKSLFCFLKSVDKWSSLHAKQNMIEGKRSNLFKIVFYPAGKLFNNLFIKMGILDGIVGVVAALMMSLHSYLSWSKLWLLQKNK